MTTMRAKLQVQSVMKLTGAEQLRMTAVSRSTGYPADGSDDDNTYAKFSPMAEFTISIANPALFGKFEPGQKFYVDFTPADAPRVAKGNPIAARHDVIPALIQTDLSQQLMPGEWLLVNMQINGAELIADIDYWRVRLNTGCGPQGELDGQPAAHRGFETADTRAESQRLARATSTSRCYNVVKVGDTYLLDESAPLIRSAGIEPIAAHPKVHAVRVVSWEALDEWVRWTAGGRPNKAD